MSAFHVKGCELQEGVPSQPKCAGKAGAVTPLRPGGNLAANQHKPPSDITGSITLSLLLHTSPG